MRTIWPSTCGLIFAECRDFRTDRYSVVSGMVLAFTGCTCTGIAAPASALAAGFCPQPAISAARATPTATWRPARKRNAENLGNEDSSSMLPGVSVLTTFRTTKWLPAPAASGERNGPLGLSLDAVQTEPLHALTFRSDPPSPGASSR